MSTSQRNGHCRHSTDLVHFRKRIGKEGVEKIFQMSICLHGEQALEAAVNIDTTVHEKNIMYPTDSKLAIPYTSHKCIALPKEKITNNTNMAAKHR